MKCFRFLLKIDLFLLVSLVLKRAIPALINYYLLSFDKVWHDGIVFRLTQHGVSGNLLNLLRDFLNEGKQRVVLNGLFST